MYRKRLLIPLVAAVMVTTMGISQNTNAAIRVAHSGETKSGKHSRDGVVGMVSSVNDSTITLIAQNSTTYSIDASKAEILKANLAPTAPSVVGINDIKNGDMLLVQGTINGSSVQATTIFDGKLFDKSSRAIEGTVSSVSGSTLSIIGTDNLTYTIDASAVSLANINSGDHVRVEGVVNGTVVNASIILEGNFTKGRSKLGQGVAGTITALNGPTLTLADKNNTIYTVDATNAKILKDYASTSIAVSEIKIGDHVLVRGSLAGTSIVAKKIFDRR